MGERRAQLLARVDGLAVDFLNQVAASKARVGCGAFGVNARDDESARVARQFRARGEFGRQRLDSDAELPALVRARARARLRVFSLSLLQRQFCERGSELKLAPVAHDREG